MLHAPPAKLPPGVPPPVIPPIGATNPVIPPIGATNVDPNLVNEPIALAVVARLSKAGVDGKTMSAIRDSMWEAIRAGNPLTLEQLHARLESLGLSAETLHGPPKSGPEDQTGSGPEEPTAE
jgi:hypothetical protein